MKLKTPAKLLYVPGMISLAMLPVLIVAFLNQRDDQRKQQVCVEIIWSREASDPPPNAGNDRHITPWPKRTWLRLEFTGDPATDRTKLEFSRLYLHDIVDNPDTEDGVHFVMNKTANYGAFVSILNMLLAEKISRYAVRDDGIWVTNFPPLALNGWMRGTCLFTDTCGQLEPEPGNETNKFLAYHSNTLGIVGTLFLFLIFLAIRKLV